MQISTCYVHTVDYIYGHLNAKYAGVAVGFLLALHAVSTVVYRLYFHPLAGHPGPFLAKVSDMYGAWHSLMGRLHIETEKGHREYVIYTSMNVRKSQGYKAMLPSPGAYNTFTSVDRSMHRRKRKVMSQGLTDQCIRRFEPTMLRHVYKFIAQLCRSAPLGEWSAEVFDMTECCRHLFYDIMGEFGFGQSFRLQTSTDNLFLVDAVNAVMRKTGVYVQWPALQKLRLETLFARRGRQMREQYARLMTDLVRSRLAAGQTDSQHDLFSFLANREGGFSADELWAESRFLLIAGGDTASTVLASLFFYLAAYPECYRKLASEVRATFESATEIRSGAKLTSCRYLRACIDEAMRVSPPVATTLWREVCGAEGLVVDGLLLPPGTDVGVSPYALHHNEQLFPDSFAFRPERWLVSPDNSTAVVERARAAFSAFSVGPRACAGRNVAYVELGDALARTVWFFDLRSADGELESLGGGQVGARYGRHRPKEFQLEDHITCHHDGPYLRFRVREGAENEALRLLKSEDKAVGGTSH
ncbi:putative benzoate 4-monooxygenase cytochrome p450 protein [Neofusicoccum parvum UCRNP2]|uniref:Putative benzoate 4-monooxygenase cytochrome p450 protein n=1 Tax=Botryosphaeria parva (strain UCR-NP2) TaxID=1287680 RepID=R1EYV4_BOTPV|nr:putative benzoate 4-monooxygenase cytochrome p450 protein [Neofusicoccum parvum UCRNP2]